MAILVEAASADRDRDVFLSALKQFLPPAASETRFDWLYRSSPFGMAQAWLVVDSETRSVIGAAAAFPRRFRHRGQTVEGCVWGDFCIDPKHRSVGPALQLQRACLKAIESGSWQIAYDFPSDSMAAIYSRLGIKISAQMVRMAKALRTERLIESKIKFQPLAAALSRAGNAALRATAAVKPPPRDYEFSRCGERCGAEFTKLADSANPDESIEVERSADYLNWRFLDHPSTPYEIYVARKDGQLVACAILAQTGADATLADLLGSDRTALRGLLSFIEDQLRERCVMTMSVPVSSSHRHRALLEDLGFRSRESHPIVGYVRSNAGGDGNKMTWSLLEGDRES
jgi:hypothetical protein